MSFSASWLALREPVDHRARNQDLAHQLAQFLSVRSPQKIMDWGCGTGSNLRALAPHLGSQQEWVLVDYDPALLQAARAAISAWADHVESKADQLIVNHHGKHLHVTFKQADLSKDMSGLLASKPDLVTAAALFDLCSTPFIAQAAKAIAASGAAFFTVLTYDGRETWQPPHEADAAILDAFIAHQKTDKGFGVSAGPDAPLALKEAFTAQGYRVFEASTPWTMSAPEDRTLMQELAKGIAHAALETGRVDPARVEAWLTARLAASNASIGHQDLLALPKA